MKKQILAFCILISASLLLTQCSGKKNSGGGSSDSSSPRVTPSSVSSPGQVLNPGDLVTDDAFYVRVFDEEKFPFYINKNERFGTNCEIVSADDSSQAIDCFVDVMEFDIAYHGLKIQYNIPREMCEYFKFVPYYYYNFEQGVGPERVYIYENTILGAAFPTRIFSELPITNLECLEDSGYPNTPSELRKVELEAVLLEGEPICVYNHQNKNLSSRLNCCRGSYIKTVNTCTQTEVTESVGVGEEAHDETRIIWASGSNSSEESWGEMDPRCFSGSAIRNWEGSFNQGVPGSISFDVKENGLNKTYDFPRSLSMMSLLDLNVLLPSFSNIIIANYVDYAIDYTSSSIGEFLKRNITGERTAYTERRGVGLEARISHFPLAIDPVTDRSGDVLGRTSEAFQFLCLDSAEEVKHKIRIFVREWNTKEDFLVYGTSGGSRKYSDVGGVEGDRIETHNSVFGCVEEGILAQEGFPFCNDRLDFKDFPKKFYPEEIGETP